MSLREKILSECGNEPNLAAFMEWASDPTISLLVRSMFNFDQESIDSMCRRTNDQGDRNFIIVDTAREHYMEVKKLEPNLESLQQFVDFINSRLEGAKVLQIEI